MKRGIYEHVKEMWQTEKNSDCNEPQEKKSAAVGQGPGKKNIQTDIEWGIH